MDNENKTLKMSVCMTKEQSRLLDVKARSFGFRSKSEYVRFILFLPLDFVEKINKIHKKVCVEDETNA